MKFSLKKTNKKLVLQNLIPVGALVKESTEVFRTIFVTSLSKIAIRET